MVLYPIDPPLAARICPGKPIGIIDFAARAARSGLGRPGVAAIEAVQSRTNYVAVVAFAYRHPLLSTREEIIKNDPP